MRTAVEDRKELWTKALNEMKLLLPASKPCPQCGQPYQMGDFCSTECKDDYEWVRGIRHDR